MSLAIETRELSKRYGEGDDLAVDAVTLRVDRGEIYALLGPNGSGKSTFVKMLVTLLAATSGSARVAGIDVTMDPEDVRSSIGVTLQDVGVDPVQTTQELLVAQGRLSGLDRASSRERASELLDVVGLGSKADDRVKTLSGGQRRRLDLALSLVHEPSILFLDEPTTGLDPSARRDLWREIRRLADAGTTIFLTTQYLEEADQLADRIGILRAGKLIEEGTAPELKDRLGRQQIVVGVDDVDKALELLAQWATEADGDTVRVEVDNVARSIPQIVSLLAGGGVDVAEVRSESSTLDDVFEQLTNDAEAVAA
ncbi:ATP-binding cassette domain-containing protein [Ilumatobacter sp.]|uniref:ATP-binding cassette domain-containing protein n=1 Tax=Ilumatobacter sp. TaxID=1967498 RepID=UPI003B520586